MAHSPPRGCHWHRPFLARQRSPDSSAQGCTSGGLSRTEPCAAGSGLPRGPDGHIFALYLKTVKCLLLIAFFCRRWKILSMILLGFFKAHEWSHCLSFFPSIFSRVFFIMNDLERHKCLFLSKKRRRFFTVHNDKGDASLWGQRWVCL